MQGSPLAHRLFALLQIIQNAASSAAVSAFRAVLSTQKVQKIHAMAGNAAKVSAPYLGKSTSPKTMVPRAFASILILCFDRLRGVSANMENLTGDCGKLLDEA